MESLRDLKALLRILRGSFFEKKDRKRILKKLHYKDLIVESNLFYTIIIAKEKRKILVFTFFNSHFKKWTRNVLEIIFH